MKQFINCTLCIVLAIFFIPHVSTAQLEVENLTEVESNKPGRKFILGGQISGNLGDVDLLGLNTYVGYKLNKHFTAGVDLRYDSVNVPFMDSFNSRSFGYAVFGRYTFNPDDKLSVFTQLSVGQNFNSIINNIDLNPGLVSSSNEFFASRLDLGLKFKINDRFDILLDVGNVFYNFTSNNLNFDFGLRSFSPRFEIKF